MDNPEKPQSLRCWCGSTDLLPYSFDYRRCAACETLVVARAISTDITRIQDEEKDLYGKQYWFGHQEKDLNLPTIGQRIRGDIIDRGLYWLRTLLKFKLPPARVLELGSAHGGFVALLRNAGYRAEGLELSPEIVALAKATFDVTLRTGPIEDQDVPEGSLDAVVLFDVLEHFPNPVSSMERSAKLLKDDGILVIQTPCYDPELSYDMLMESKNRFQEMLKPGEHLFLFSRKSLTNPARKMDFMRLRHTPKRLMKTKMRTNL